MSAVPPMSVLDLDAVAVLTAIRFGEKKAPTGPMLKIKKKKMATKNRRKKNG